MMLNPEKMSGIVLYRFITKSCKDDENIIIVSHGDTLSIFNAIWLGMDVDMLNKCDCSVERVEFLYAGKC